MKNPTIFSSSNYESLDDIVAPKTYRMYDDRHNLPPAIKGVGGYSSSGNHVATIITKSSTTDSPPTIGRIVPASSAPIYGIATIRKDAHSGGEPHVNIDYSLIFKDNRGNSWRMKATDKSRDSGHYLKLSKDSELDILHDLCRLPYKDYGTWDDLKSSVVVPRFSTGATVE